MVRWYEENKVVKTPLYEAVQLRVAGFGDPSPAVPAVYSKLLLICENSHDQPLTLYAYANGSNMAIGQADNPASADSYVIPADSRTVVLTENEFPALRGAYETLELRVSAPSTPPTTGTLNVTFYGVK